MAERTPLAVYGVTSARFKSTGAEGLKCRMLRFLGNTEEPLNDARTLLWWLQRRTRRKNTGLL